MADLQRAADAKRELDRVAAAFFRAVSFEPGEVPRFGDLRALFIVQGLLVNNSGSAPQALGVGQFIATRQATFESARVSRYRVSELSDTTEVFGGIAHRASAFARSGVKDGRGFDVRGMIFFQFVRTPDGWKISAVTWDDLRSGQMLGTHAEPTEFGA